MPTFECNGLIDPKNMKPHKIVYNNFVLNGLTNPMNFNSNKINFNKNKINFNKNELLKEK